MKKMAERQQNDENKTLFANTNRLINKQYICYSAAKNLT